MKSKNNVAKITFVLFVFASALFLSGCFENNQPQEQVLRNAEEYNVRTYAQREADSSPAAHRLSVSAPASPDASPGGPADGTSNKRRLPPMQIDQNKTYSAILKTDEGNITIALDAKRVPITVNNFIALSKDNFYNGTVFHRVIKDFMIQGGDPKGDGSGGPGYKFDDENLEGSYTRGTVAMANSGPNTNGSQFFIIHKNYALPNKYVIFGHVSDGLDVVDKIAGAEVADNGAGEKSKPVTPVKINLVEIKEK